MSRHLLIDADVLAYKAACSVERATEWEPGYWTWHADEGEAKDAVDREIEYIMDTLEGDQYSLALTDDQTNFRKAILPTYKGNRANVRKPLVLKAVRQWLLDERDAKVKPTLEGDDILGILATMKSRQSEERIIVSIDKDMKTIPGLYIRDIKDEVTEVSSAQADFWHMYQTLMGDATDGYKGCPGIGAKKAYNMLADAVAEGEPMWPAVVKAFVKAGLYEEEALVQARVARILRASDYDFKKKEPILWSP